MICLKLIGTTTGQIWDNMSIKINNGNNGIDLIMVSNLVAFIK